MRHSHPRVPVPATVLAGPRRLRRTLLFLLPLCAVPSLAAQTPTSVSPAAGATGSGNSNNWYPFGGAPFVYQQVHAGSSVSSPGPLTVQTLSFRPTSVQTPGSVDVELFMAKSPHGPEAASGTFASNVVAGTEVNVFLRRMVNLPTPQPGSWVLSFPFDAPFSWDGGDLSWRVIVHGNSFGNQRLYYSVEAFSNLGSSNPTGSVTGCQSALGTAASAHYSRVEGPGGIALLFAYSYVAAGGLPAILTFGTSTKSAGGVPLPLGLGFLGAPGCFLTNDIAASVTATTQAGPEGYVEVRVPIPNRPSLTGRHVLTQYLFVQSGANALGVFTSNGLDSTIGRNHGLTRITAFGSGSATSGGTEKQYGLTIGLN